MDLIDEVRDEIRRERWMNFWKAFGGYFVAASIVVIVGTVGIVSWQNYTEKRALREGAQYLAALELVQADQPEAAAAALAILAKDGGSGFVTLAELREAEMLLRAGKTAEAGERYRALAKSRKADPAVRTLATLYAAQISARDAARREENYAALDALIRQADYFSPMAKETKAYVALELGDVDLARILLVELSLDQNAPPSLRQRAREVQSSLPAEKLDLRAADKAKE